MIYGKLTNNQLLTPKSIDLGGGQFITNPTNEQYIAHGYKEVVDIQPSFANYDKSYTETATQIFVNYVEVVVPPMVWHEDTQFQIKFTADGLLDLLEEVPAMIEYTKTLTIYRDMIFRYFYVNFFNDMERELIEYYGGIVTERSIL